MNWSEYDSGLDITDMKLPAVGIEVGLIHASSDIDVNVLIEVAEGTLRYLPAAVKVTPLSAGSVARRPGAPSVGLPM